ncbi:MAG: hypothetical protein NTX55_00015, partial [Candidatus Parcubacteria bacterium]|nr:hypothetical protein [Candidatus Parcubacteria bacterium]
MKLTLKKILKNKKLTTVITIVLILAVYFGYKTFFGTKTATRYVTAAVEKGTLIVSVTGTGQVSASNQIDLKPKASGNVVYIGVNQGQEVGAGTLLLKLDATDAEKTVRDAQINLDSAKLVLEKLVGPNGTTSPRNKQDAQDNLSKAYDDGFTNVANTFLDLPTNMTGLQNLLFSNDKTLSNGTQANVDYYADAVKGYDPRAIQYSDDTKIKYQLARSKYEKNYEDYKAASRLSSPAAIDALVNETYDTVKSVSDAIKSA